MTTQHGAVSGESDAESSTPRLARGLRRLFVFHAAVTAAIGVPLLLVPELWAVSINWGETFDPRMARIAGSLFIGFALAQALAYRAQSWGEVRLLFIAVLTEVLVLFAVNLGHAVPSGSTEDWLLVGLSGIFAVAFLSYGIAHFHD